MHNKTVLTIDDRQLKLSNLNKVFYPSVAFNKGQVIDYYIRIAPFLLPHLKNRPLTLKRYPNGAMQNFFYQKECPAWRPNWLPTAPVWSESNQKHTNFCIVNDLPALIWTANLAALELHTSLSLVPAVMQPTMLVFDLDPGPPAAVLDCAAIALRLRHVLTALQLECFVKTSGSKGLQVYVPLNLPTDYGQTKQFAHQMALLLEKAYPQQVVSNMRKDLRTGKVFVDWSQNDDHKTTVCVYSLRAGQTPTVSTPVTWKELEAAARAHNAAALVFQAQHVLERTATHGDLFAPLLTIKQPLPRQDALATVEEKLQQL